MAGVAGCSGALDRGSSGGDGGGPDEEDEDPFTMPIEGEAEMVAYGDEVSGELTEDHPSDEQFNGIYEPWTFEAAAGDVVTVEMSSQTGDTYLYVLDEDGEVLTQNDDGGGWGLDAKIAGLEIPESDTYVVVAGGYESEGTFKYTLSVEEGVDEPTEDLREIAVGETKTGYLDGTDPEDSRYNGHYEPVTLDAVAGDTITVEMSSFDGDSYLYLVGPQDSILAENDDASFLDARIDSYTLPETGEYTIVASSWAEGGAFEYELSVRNA